jgi:hypothetical protein
MKRTKYFLTLAVSLALSYFVFVYDMARSPFISNLLGLKMQPKIVVRLSNTPEKKTKIDLVDREKQIFKTNTWLWNENIFQYSTILSVDPHSTDLEMESLVFFRNSNTYKRNENTKCMVLMDNERLIDVTAAEILFMVVCGFRDIFNCFLKIFQISLNFRPDL